MPIASGFTKDRNPTYYIRKPAANDYANEQIYYKRELPPEKPIQIQISPKPPRPIVKETIFLPERGTEAPIAPPRDLNTVSPKPGPIVYTTKKEPAAKSSFNLLRALALNADCPCWSWILIVAGLLILLGLLAMCLYFVLARERRV